MTTTTRRATLAAGALAAVGRLPSTANASRAATDETPTPPLPEPDGEATVYWERSATDPYDHTDGMELRLEQPGVVVGGFVDGDAAARASAIHDTVRLTFVAEVGEAVVTVAPDLSPAAARRLADHVDAAIGVVGAGEVAVEADVTAYASTPLGDPWVAAGGGEVGVLPAAHGGVGLVPKSTPEVLSESGRLRDATARGILHFADDDARALVDVLRAARPGGEP